MTDTQVKIVKWDLITVIRYVLRPLGHIWEVVSLKFKMTLFLDYLTNLNESCRMGSHNSHTFSKSQGCVCRGGPSKILNNILSNIQSCTVGVGLLILGVGV